MHADKWAPAAAVLLALCLAGVEAVTGTLRTLGLGFLLEDAVLLPLLGGLLGAAVWSLAVDRRYHRVAGPTVTSLAAAGLVFAGVWLGPAPALAGAGLLAGAAVWNHVLVGRLSEQRARAREADRKLG